jgi:TolB-like protein
MNRSIIIAAVVISGAILLNGYLDRAARAPRKPPLIVREKTIAVLPFQDLSSSEQNAGFAAGIQQEIINRLTKVHDLKVVSQSDVMRYNAAATRNLREISQRLGAANLLEGSVQHADDQVRVNVQLIDAKTDTHLWGDSYDRKLTDVFTVESEIAKAVADQLGARLSPAEKAAITEDRGHP